MTKPAPTTTTTSSENVQLLNIWWEALTSIHPHVRPESQPAQAVTSMYDNLRKTDPDAARQFLRGKRSEIRKALLGCRSRSGAYELAEAEQVAAVLEGMGLVRSVGNRPQDYRDEETTRPVTTRLREVARMHYPWDTDAGRQWLRDSWPAIMSLPMADLKRVLREMRTAPTPTPID